MTGADERPGSGKPETRPPPNVSPLRLTLAGIAVMRSERLLS